MNVKLIKAMLRCCSQKPGDTLAQPTLVRGELCATDRVVAVRYREPKWDPDKMPRRSWQLYAHEIAGLKPSAKVGVNERGFAIPGGKSHGYPSERYPDLRDLWDTLTRNDKGWQLDYDPKQVRKVLAVFEAAGANVEVRDSGCVLLLSGWNSRDGASITALVMGCHR